MSQGMYVVHVNRVYVNVCFCFNQRRVFKCWAISRPSWNKRESSENFKERIVTLIKCRRWMVGNYKKATVVPREIYKFNFNKLIVWKGILFSQNKRETWMHYAVVVTQPRKTSKDTKTNTKIACMINGCIYRCIAEYSPFIHVSAATIYFRSSFIKEGFFLNFMQIILAISALDIFGIKDKKKSYERSEYHTDRIFNGRRIIFKMTLQKRSR